ncbi:MAG TPA: ABC transporter permease [Bryobacteraceae bacterium]|nr:ABC transporter permease [Bryobacteraceae bacterium]
MIWKRLHGMFHDDARIDEEIASHLELLAAEFESRGMSPHEARMAARRAFGGVAQVRESWREQRGLPFVESLRQDLRHARGQMCKHPVFSVTAILTLALGIGANSVVYQVLDSVVYRPLPVRAPHQLELVKVVEDGKEARAGVVSQDFTYPAYTDLAKRQTVADSLIAASFGDAPTDEGPNTPKIQISLVSGNFFTSLGAPIALGRALTPADDRPGAPPVTVISHRFWEKHFGSAPAAVGQKLRAGHTEVTVVGVADRKFYGVMLGFEPDAWLPAVLQPQILAVDWLRANGQSWLNVFARLRPGVTPSRAQTALDALYHGMPENSHRHLSLAPGYRGIPMMQDGVALLGWAAMALVTIVLLIACCNLANLLLGRSSARIHEIGVRMALGAGRRRVMLQLATESFCLAVIGALLALPLAAWASAALADIWSFSAISEPLSWRTVLFSILMAGIATCLFGLAPAVAATRVDLLSALQANRRSYSAGRSTHRLGRTLIATQIAVSVLLLYGAALLGRSLWNLQHRDFGFRTERLLLANFAWDTATAMKMEAEDPAAQPLYDRLNRIPGVVSAALSSSGPLSNSTYTSPLSTPERPSEADDTLVVRVSPRYFETMGTRILDGRGITEADRKGSQRVAVLAESEARRLFGGADPVGRFVSENATFQNKDALLVVGVARDVIFAGPRDTAGRLYYVPLAQAPAPVISALVRTSGNPDAVAAMVRAALHEIASDREIAKLEPVTETIEEALGTDYLLSVSSSGFSVLALALTALGIYGVISYAMAGRTREIGIRLALGATPTSVPRLVVREYAWLVGISAAVGAAAAIAASRLLRGILFGTAANDYLMLLGAAAALAGVAALAGWLPARRASRLDPMDALREE